MDFLNWRLVWVSTASLFIKSSVMNFYATFRLINFIYSCMLHFNFIYW